MFRHPPRSPLFPYTTLFRSNTGSISLLVDVQTTDFTNAAAAGVSVYLGDNPSPPACSSSTEDRKSTRLNSSHANISYAVFCLKKKKKKKTNKRQKQIRTR